MIDFIKNSGIVSAIISALAALFALFQANSAKKSYRLQQQIYREGRPNLLINEISNSFIYNDKKAAEIFYFLECSISNLSDKATAITKIHLKLVCRDCIIILRQQENTKIDDSFCQMKVPYNIPPHNTVSGWFSFPMDKSTYDTVDIDTHFIIACDINDIQHEKEVISISERLINYEI